MTHAIVLVEAERDVMSTLGGALAEVDGVREAYSVTGEWDFVCIVHVKQHEDLANVVTSQISSMHGVARTHTMVAFEAFSRHDLETMFSIGGCSADSARRPLARAARRRRRPPRRPDRTRPHRPVVRHQRDADRAGERSSTAPVAP